MSTTKKEQFGWEPILLTREEWLLISRAVIAYPESHGTRLKIVCVDYLHAHARTRVATEYAE
jgi:hypothetical protein